MARLKIDVPLFKRCCFCVPLRYGLFALGCLKLYLLVMAFSKSLYDFTTSPMPWLHVLEIIFNVLLIVATIMKRERLYDIYYKCALLELVFTMSIFVFVQIRYWQFWSRSGYFEGRSSNPRHEVTEWLLFVIVDSFMILGFLVQGYITLLVRSVLIKRREAASSTDNTVELESQSSVGKSVEV